MFFHKVILNNWYFSVIQSMLPPLIHDFNPIMIHRWSKTLRRTKIILFIKILWTISIISWPNSFKLNYLWCALSGIIDGGTWEHRKRAREMLETAEKNSAQTMLGRGSHFMGDFLPVITISLLKPKLYYMVRSLQSKQSVMSSII